MKRIYRFASSESLKTEENDGSEAIGLKIMAWIMYAVIYGLWGLFAIQVLKGVMSLLV